MSPLEIRPGLAEPAFPRESISEMCRLLTYRVEKWGYDNYPGMWPNEPVMPLTRVRDIDLTPMTIRGVLPWRQYTQEQDFNGDSREITQLRRWEDVLSFGRKRKRADSLVEEDEAMQSTRISKRVRSEAGTSRPQTVIHFPSVLVRCIGGGPADLKWFSLLSDEEKDVQTIDGWNKCVISGRRGSATKSSMISMQEFSCAKKNPAKIFEMFGSCNILFFGKETSPMSWSLPALCEIGPIDVRRKVQDHRSHSMTTATVHMSLREIFEDGLKDEGLTFGADPLHSILASQVPAFEGTVGLLPEEVFNPQYPCGAISFWTVSMKGAIRHIHSNGAGVGTVVEVVCGRQLFYIFRRSESTVNDSCIDEYLEDWAPGFIPDSDKWEAELVVLEPGLAFCMRPDMHYAVVTLENTIAKGHRFYTSSVLQKSVSGWVHTSMLGSTITDDLHLEFQEVFLRMISYFSVIIRSRRDELEGHGDIHVPSISTRGGLLNLIALGNLCVFSSALNRCVRGCGFDEKRKSAIAAAVVAYSSIIEYADERYRLVLLRVGVQNVENADHLGNIQMDIVSITDFAHSSAAHFAQSLIAYAPKALERRKALGQQESALFNFEAFKRDIKDAMMEFMDKDFTDGFIKAYESQSRKMMHFKPKFLVKKNPVELQHDILDEWRGITDYSPSDDEDREREGDDDGEDEEGIDGDEVEVERDEDMGSAFSAQASP
ncbi:hypothetical protein IW262DRAFT_1454495 [Armillaria fumosa]|nr:hypothetical protein IW262DRAFT_1454495 [Armillaria fumosa]